MRKKSSLKRFRIRYKNLKILNNPQQQLNDIFEPSKFYGKILVGITQQEYGIFRYALKFRKTKNYNKKANLNARV